MGRTEVAKVGQDAPYFASKSASGRLLRINNFLGKQNLILFFMPDLGEKSEKMAVEFNENMGYFHQGQTAVLGVCPEKPEKLKEFATRLKLFYQLLTDDKGNIFETYGSFSFTGKPARFIYLISSQGKLEHAIKKPYTSKSVEEAKKAVKKVAHGLTLAQ